MSGVPMQVKLTGLNCELTHVPSGAKISTTPPKDNGGEGDRFSPTDLVGAALASCAITTMALISAREGLTYGPGAGASVEKIMSPPPRRIAELVLKISMPPGTKPAERPRLEEIARTCPVARSLHPDVKLPIEFSYP